MTLPVQEDSEQFCIPQALNSSYKVQHRSLTPCVCVCGGVGGEIHGFVRVVQLLYN